MADYHFLMHSISRVLIWKIVQHPKAEWQVYVTAALTIGTVNSAFCIYGFCVILSINGYYFLKQR
jgi:hypothetical protein